MKVIKIGDKFKLTKLPDYAEDVTIDKVYTIRGFDQDGDSYFMDDKDERNFAVIEESYEDYGVVWLEESIAKPILEAKEKLEARDDVERGFY